MGCFKVTGAISNSVISWGDDIVLFLGVRCLSPNVINEFAPGFEFTPIALPIFGKYNDYGGIENIQRDANVEIIESYFGSDIDSILSLVDDRAVDRYIEDDKKHLAKKLADFEKNFKRYYDKKARFQLATAIEHRFVYDLMVNDVPHYFGYDFDRSYEKTIEYGFRKKEQDEDTEDAIIAEIEERRKLDECFRGGHDKDNYYRSITYLAPWAANSLWISCGYFQKCSGYMFAEYFLYLYRGEKDYELFNPSLKDSFIGILKFMDYLSYNSIIFKVHNYHGQDTGYESMLRLHTALAEFYKKKRDDEKEEEEDD